MRLWLDVAKNIRLDVIKKALLRQHKGDDVNLNETERKFHALTPTESAALGIYESALDFAFSNPKLKMLLYQVLTVQAKVLLSNRTKRKKGLGINFCISL